MDINPQHIEYRKVVGKLGNNKVFELATTGGLHMIVVAKDGRFETGGVGSHRAVARHIALKKYPDITWTDLSKSDHVEAEHFAFCLPRFEAMTDRLRQLQGLK